MIAVLRGLLTRLDDPGREQPALLHPPSSGRRPRRRQRPGEDVGRRHRVLDRQIDADPADRRHCVRGVADRQQSGPMTSASAGRA